MKHLVSVTVGCVLLVLLARAGWAARVGGPAPDFTGTDSHHKVHTLSAYRGRYVVLEWHNNGCPYTRKHYDSGNMQRLQKRWTGRGVVWLTIISSAPGTQGHVTAAEENAYLRAMNTSPTAAILDPKGDIGHLYSAKTTPQMIIIDPTGVLIYDGAIDERPTADVSDIAGAMNYVSAALEEALSGKPVTVPSTRPYGCSVKYGDSR